MHYIDLELLDLPHPHWTRWSPAWEDRMGAVSYGLPSSTYRINSNKLGSYLLEHGLQPDGRLNPEAEDRSSSGTFSTLFSETESGKYVPRSIFVDLDPSPIDEIRTGAHKQLFDLEGLVSGKGDTENNYARGRYTIGKELLETVEDKLRRMTGQPPYLLLDTCDILDGPIFL
jgi:hypothetical protein